MKESVMFAGPRGDEWFWKKMAWCSHGWYCAKCCMPWKGCKSGIGYGVTRRVLKSGRSERYTHRIAWIIKNEMEIPQGSEVAHTCDNPPCCNPSHLVLMSHVENIQDSVNKGRRLPSQVRGEDIGTAKLTSEEVEHVWRLWKAGASQKYIAAYMNVRQPTISNILNRKTWRHISIPS